MSKKDLSESMVIPHPPSPLCARKVMSTYHALESASRKCMEFGSSGEMRVRAEFSVRCASVATRQNRNPPQNHRI